MRQNRSTTWVAVPRMTVAGARRGALRAAALLAGLSVSGCLIFPAPTPPAPLTKSEVAGVAKCQKAVEKAQLAFIKTKLSALTACVNGVLNVRLAFESGLATADELDAGIAKMRPKCSKGYAKVTAASTKLVDAIVKACSPVASHVIGPYDALRFVSAQDSVDDPPASVPALAGAVCTATTELVDSQLWHAAPRLLELLGYLGPEYVVLFDVASGLPNVPLDPRCPPVTNTPL